MIELRALGPLELYAPSDADPDAVLRQPKRLALLTYLACARPHGYHRRDSLLGLFWPDLDQSHARAALRRAVHFLRRALGDEVLVGRGDEEVAVPAQALTSDVATFLEALGAGRDRDALIAYRGDLLEGVFVASAPGFEEWLDRERRHLREEAARAAWRLVGAAPEEAERFARRAVELDPYDEDALRRLMRLLHDRGDAAGAVTAYLAFRARCHEELDLDPDTETQALAEEIRASRPEITDTIADTPREAPTTLAIFPFAIRGPASIAYLGEGLVDLLASKLDGTGGIRPADPRLLLNLLAREGIEQPSLDEALVVARRLHATALLLGTMVTAGERIQLLATTYDLTGTRTLTAEAVGEQESDIFDLVDAVTRQLLAAESPSATKRLLRVSATTTPSLAALRHYVEGERHVRSGRFFEAVECFEHAVAEDPDFAVAHHRAASSLAACALPDMARASAAQAVGLRGRLSGHDRLLVDAQAAWLAGDATRAEALYAEVVDRYPDDVEAWFLLGDVLVHHNPYRGRSIAEARPALERAIALDAEHLNATGQLARIAALEGRVDELGRLAGRIERLSPEGAPTLPIRALGAFAVGDPAAEKEVLSELKGARALTIAVAFADVALYAGNEAGTDRFADEFLAVARSEELQAVCHLIRAHVAMGQGRVNAALQEVARAERLHAPWALEVRGLFAALPFGGLPPEVIVDARRALRGWDAASAPMSWQLPLLLHNDLHGPIRDHLLTLLAAGAGDWDEAEAALASLGQYVAPPGSEGVVATLAAGARARLLWARGETDAALAVLEAPRPPVWFQYAVASPFYGGGFERYLRAELLWAVGRREEACGWYGSLAQRSPFELIYRRIAAERLAESP